MEGKRLYHLFGTLFARECLPVENEGDALRGDFNATHEQFHQAVPFAEREFLHQNRVHDSALDGLEVGVLAFARHLGHEFGLLQLGLQEGTNLPLQEVGGQTAYLATVALEAARARAVADVVTVGAACRVDGGCGAWGVGRRRRRVCLAAGGQRSACVRTARGRAPHACRSPVATTSRKSKLRVRLGRSRPCGSPCRCRADYGECVEWSWPPTAFRFGRECPRR